jgi:hypothetical protein
MANERQIQAKRNMQMEQARRNQTLRRQGLQPTEGARTMSENMEQITGQIRPGNIGAINRVIWPFWFTFTAPTLAPGASASGFTTITQEAGFVWMSYTKAVFTKTVGPVVYTYINPNTVGTAGQADNLSMVVRDASSSRQLHNLPIQMDSIGNPNFPSQLETPVMFLPNATIEIAFTNQNASLTFVPYVTFFGYRIRVEDSENILSLVNG